ncbi:MAG: alpha-L-fucosidase [Clostridia bacterium]|nr:alpha-L-fucosidase [Clostridia bacterium]
MKIKPTKGQLNFLNWEFGMFFHFGIRSFYPGHKDWDGIEMPAEGFNPAQLNCDQWMRVARDAGATYTILTTKHHDGFALWPSQYSHYSVANTPWKEGNGDVVREYVDACRKYGMKVGLYYSPAQWGSTAIPFSAEKEYDDYFINQITELLTNYGKIDYLWFDGCGSEGHVYDHKRIVGEIFRLQPDILTFCDPEWFPCVRWVGNEDGYASLENPYVISKWDFSQLTEESVSLSQARFLPAECDCKLRDTWFYDRNENTIKSLDELFGMYEQSVGRGSNFLINVGPDERGLIPEADAKRMRELGEKIRENYRTPIDFANMTEETVGVYAITHPQFDEKNGGQRDRARAVNTVVLAEDLTEGQGIREFRVYATLPAYNHKRILLYCGCTVGHKTICRFPTVYTPKITVEITDSDGVCKLNSINAYFVK